ncbi:hypothetical protein [Kordia sp.]|uniref:hypothetical protein n=1 Tax=Kordia sp. TaxID=1965332 RepID=UPI003D6C1902
MKKRNSKKLLEIKKSNIAQLNENQKSSLQGGYTFTTVYYTLITIQTFTEFCNPPEGN